MSFIGLRGLIAEHISRKRCTNNHGWYLALSEYGGGGAERLHRCFEGREGRGWSNCVVKLRNLVAFLILESKVLFLYLSMPVKSSINSL